MEFDWDEEKNLTNLRKHGLAFSDAWEAFEGPLLVKLDTSANYGEDRWIGIGVLKSHPITVVLVFTEKEHDLIRIISMRKANSNEQSQYEKAIKQ